jgi:hypothetical protein
MYVFEKSLKNLEDSMKKFNQTYLILGAATTHFWLSGFMIRSI